MCQFLKKAWDKYEQVKISRAAHQQSWGKPLPAQCTHHETSYGTPCAAASPIVIVTVAILLTFLLLPTGTQ